MTAAEENRIRRRANVQAAEVRRIYEEMVLKKPQAPVVQIGSLDALKTATPGNGSAALTASGGNGHAAPSPVAADNKAKAALVSGD
jgi:hypothetical protein